MDAELQVHRSHWIRATTLPDGGYVALRQTLYPLPGGVLVIYQGLVEGGGVQSTFGNAILAPRVLAAAAALSRLRNLGRKR